MTDEMSVISVTETAYIAKTIPETGLRVTFREWDRLREKVKTMPEPSDWARNLGWTCVGLFGGSVLALLPWLAAYAALPEKSQQQYAWITIALGGIGIVAAITSRLAFWFDGQNRTYRAWSSQQICDDMDAVTARFDRATPATPASGKTTNEPRVGI